MPPDAPVIVIIFLLHNDIKLIEKEARMDSEIKDLLVNFLLLYVLQRTEHINSPIPVGLRVRQHEPT